MLLRKNPVTLQSVCVPFFARNQSPFVSLDCLLIGFTARLHNREPSGVFLAYIKIRLNFSGQRRILQLVLDTNESLSFSSLVCRYLLGQATCNSSHIVSFCLDQGAIRSMIECASTHNVTLATVCAACHAGFLFELTNDWDVAFETTVANRPQEPQATHILGNFFYLPLMRVHLENKRETTLATLLETIQAHTNSALLHARAQWSPVGNKTLELSDDRTVVYYPITSFQFEQYRKSFTLDSSSTTEPVELEYVHNDRDSLLSGLWARAAGRSAFFTEAFYIIPDMQLTFGMFFSSASYNESTSVSIRGLRYIAIE